MMHTKAWIKILISSIFAISSLHASTKYFCHQEQTPPGQYHNRLIEQKFSGREILEISNNGIDGKLLRSYDQKEMYKFKIGQESKLEDVKLCLQTREFNSATNALCVLTHLTYEPSRRNCMEKCLKFEEYKNSITVQRIDSSLLKLNYSIFDDQSNEKQVGSLSCYNQDVYDYLNAFMYGIYVDSYRFENILEIDNKFYVAKPERNYVKFYELKNEVITRGKKKLSLSLDKLVSKKEAGKLKILKVSDFQKLYPVSKIRHAECYDKNARYGKLSIINGGDNLVIDTESPIFENKTYQSFFGTIQKDSNEIKLLKNGKNVIVRKVNEDTFIFNDYLCFQN